MACQITFLIVRRLIDLLRLGVGVQKLDQAADVPVFSGTGLPWWCAAGHDLACSLPFSTWSAGVS